MKEFDQILSTNEKSGAYRARKFQFSIECFECFGEPELALIAVFGEFHWVFEKCITKLTPIFHEHNSAHFHEYI